MEFYSHPDKKLIDHLKEVYKINMGKIDKNYTKAYEIVSYCHDFGKFTTYFQKYLLDKGEKSKLSNHGFISALFAGFCAIKEFGEENSIPLIIYNVVLHHHGDLENPSKDLPSRLNEIQQSDYILIEKIEIAKKQMEDILSNKNNIEKNYEVLGYKKHLNEFLNLNIEDIIKKLKRIEARTDRNRKEENYFIHQILYSALISADKLSASGTEIPEEKYASFDVLNKEKEKKLKGKDGVINRIRSEIFGKIQDNIKKYYEKSKIFTITSPTGTGKTYAGFFAALKLKELLNDNRRIIYSLPFTSIIEQNYDVIYELFKNVEDFHRGSSRYLIKHHSLANIAYDADEYDIDKLKAELLIENWNSGIVITTFVQLLETLIGTRNRMLKKLINLKGSIILLDEVQAIDVSLLPLVDYILKKACEYYDSRIIMMTATKPFILNEAIELLDDNEKYFKFFNRTKLIPRLENRGLSEFLEEFKKNLENKSYMIVCNTINESLKIFKGLEDIDRKVFYLSTNLLPIHRREKIKEIKECLDRGEKIILVSTQVVEAGVDFDFDVVIRDIGPIDSIIQCGGRCNRNGLKEVGEVYVYYLFDEKDEMGSASSSFGKYVYGNSTLSISKEILQNKEEIFENEYFDLISQYFEKIQNAKSKDKSQKYINSIRAMNFSDEDNDKIPLYKFSLIEENIEYFDAFIIYDDTAQSVFDKYCEMVKEKDFCRRREIYLEIKNNLSDYTLSLPKKYEGKFIKESGLFIIPLDGAKDHYNEITGFEREEKSFDII